MSYIRCLSNPERLYVWSDVDGHVHLHYGGDSAPKPPHSKGDVLRVPHKTFMDAVRHWDREGDWDGLTSVGGFRIEEVYIYTKSGKKVQEAKDGGLKRLIREGRTNPAEYKIRVSYKGNFVNLWRVTWQYVVHNVMERYRCIRENRLRKKLSRLLSKGRKKTSARS